MFPSSSSQPLIYPSLGFADVPFNSQSSFPSQSQTDLSQGNDPNSPEVFKQNVHLIQQQLSRTQDLARSALFGMCVCKCADHECRVTEGGIVFRENAYRPGTSPTQTSGATVSYQIIKLLTSEGV